jgi:septal ring factor EnvC (AmiA/AmiB activator)
VTDPKPGIFKVVSAYELEGQTSLGWQFVERFSEGQATTLSEMTPVAGVNGSYPQTMSGSRGAVVKHPLFLLWKSEESALVLKQGEIDRLNKQVSEVKEQKDALDKNLKETTVKLANVEGRLIVEQDVIKNLRTKEASWTEASKQIEKLKTDFGKIWTAIGDFKMREILGADAKNPKPLAENERRTVYDHLQQAELDEGDDGS